PTDLGHDGDYAREPFVIRDWHASCDCVSLRSLSPAVSHPHPRVPCTIGNPTERIKRKSRMYGYLIDMDGVIYRGSQLIPGADRFVRELRSQNIPFLFLTNNSQRTRRDVATKAARLGIDVEE